MRFEKFNANPKGLKSADCVIRAISKATGESWEDTYKGLFELSLKMRRVFNEKQVFEKYLEQKGWTKQKMPRHYNNKRFTVGELVDSYIGSQIIMSVAHHLTYAEDKVLYDTWDCSRKSVGNYWVR